MPAWAQFISGTCAIYHRDIGKKYGTNNLLMPTSIHFEGLFTPSEVEHESDATESWAANNFNLVLALSVGKYQRYPFAFMFAFSECE